MYAGGERRAEAVKVVWAGGRVGPRLVIRIRSDSSPLEPNDARAGSEQSKGYWMACVMSCGEYMESDIVFHHLLVSYAAKKFVEQKEHCNVS